MPPSFQTIIEKRQQRKTLLVWYAVTINTVGMFLQMNSWIILPVHQLWCINQSCDTSLNGGLKGHRQGKLRSPLASIYGFWPMEWAEQYSQMHLLWCQELFHIYYPQRLLLASYKARISTMYTHWPAGEIGTGPVHTCASVEAQRCVALTYVDVDFAVLPGVSIQAKAGVFISQVHTRSSIQTRPGPALLVGKIKKKEK